MTEIGGNQLLTVMVCTHGSMYNKKTNKKTEELVLETKKMHLAGNDPAYKGA
jgi:hypothetical protein